MRIALVSGRGHAPQLTSAPEPRAPAAGELTLRLHAAALNFADLLMAEGRYQDQPGFPYVPGLEGAGTVLAAGPGVALAPGTRVAVAATGTLAERMTVAADRAVPLPDALPEILAAGMPVAYGTSHLALTDRAGLRAGETLVVTGAGGGVGLTAVEIGAAMGARVVAVTRGSAKAGAVRAAGAAEVLDAEGGDDLRAALKRLGGADVVYDAVGGAVGLAAFGALRPGGRFLLIGFASGEPPALPLNHALVKNISIHGFYWGGMRALDPARLSASLAEIFALAADGRLRPQAGLVVPLERIAEGWEALRSARATGKVVVTIGPGDG